MKHIEYRSIITYIIPLLIFVYPTSLLSETSQNKTLIGDESTQIEIRSDTFEVDNKGHVVTFIGDVEAIRDDIKINCQKIELFYENLPDANDSENKQVRVLEIIATEDVRLSRPDGGMAMAEKAVYNQNDEEVVLTGNPAVIKQADDVAEGEKIIYYLREDIYVVEGKAKAIIFPNK